MMGVIELVDVLSQNEIDALLAALSSGEMDADELKKEETQKKSALTISNGPCASRKIISAVLRGFMITLPAILRRTFRPNCVPLCRSVSYK